MHSDPMWRRAFLKMQLHLALIVVSAAHHFWWTWKIDYNGGFQAVQCEWLSSVPTGILRKLILCNTVSKGQVVTHFEKQTVKCIEPMVAKWLFHYLLLFKPFEDKIWSMHAGVSDEVMFAGRQQHLLTSKSGAMTPNEYINIVNLHFKKYCKVDLEMAGWHHSFTALAEEHVSADDPDKPDELHTGTTIANNQMGHSNAMGNVHYGNTTKDPIGGFKYFVAVAAFSKKWQMFILGKTTSVLKTVDSMDNSVAAASEKVQDAVSPRITNNTTNITYQVNISSSTPLDGSVFTKLHGTAGILKWGEMCLRQIYHSVEQIKLHPKPFQFPGTKKCFDTIYSNSLGDYICVLPTGSGKSSIYQYLAISNLDKTQDAVLVVVPLKELLENQIQVSDCMKLPYIQYTRDKHPANMV